MKTTIPKTTSIITTQTTKSVKPGVSSKAPSTTNPQASTLPEQTSSIKVTSSQKLNNVTLSPTTNVTSANNPTQVVTSTSTSSTTNTVLTTTTVIQSTSSTRRRRRKTTTSSSPNTTVIQTTTISASVQASQTSPPKRVLKTPKVETTKPFRSICLTFDCSFTNEDECSSEIHGSRWKIHNGTDDQKWEKIFGKPIRIKNGQGFYYKSFEKWALIFL